MPEKRKVGIISCSGEDYAEGTISRVATRLVLEQLRPNVTVTICLPLFLAGGKEEREFARDYPTITVDGCDKMCAKVATERYSGKPTSSVVVTDLTRNLYCSRLGPRRRLDAESLRLARRVARGVAHEVDEILGRWM
jgi:uncharacterized metal-binding protein